MSVNRDSSQSGASARVSGDGCSGSSPCGGGGGSSGGRREEGGGPRGLHTLTLSSSLGGRGGGAAERGGQAQFYPSRPVSQSSFCSLAPWLGESCGFGWQYAAVRTRGPVEWGAEPGVRGKMPILLFLIDTSASMNQRTDLGTSYLDIAKGAVELFLKVKGAEGRDGERSRGMGGG